MNQQLKKQLKKCSDALSEFERTRQVKAERRLEKEAKRLDSLTPPGYGNKRKKRKVNWLYAQRKYRPYQRPSI